jgi:hypothetical protein
MNPSTGVVFSYIPRPELRNRSTTDQRYHDFDEGAGLFEAPGVCLCGSSGEKSDAERKLYDHLKKDLIIPLKTRYRCRECRIPSPTSCFQMSNGAVYDENKDPRFIHSRKIEMLEDLIEAANGHSRSLCLLV